MENHIEEKMNAACISGLWMYTRAWVISKTKI